MTRQHVHLRPSGNGSLVFKNDFIINCIYIIHTNTHTHTLLIQSDPAYVFAPPIYGPQLHDVMAALKIKTNTDRLPASAFLKLTPSHTAIEKKEHTRTHTHTQRFRHAHVVGGGWCQSCKTAGIISRLVHGDCFCEMKNGLCNPQQTEEQRLHVCFFQRGNSTTRVLAAWWSSKTAACLCTDPKTTSSSPRAHDWSNGQRLGQICSYLWGLCPARLQMPDLWGYISSKTGCGQMSGSHGWKMFRL